MPEIAGTIPAVKERPKVAKRPTIVASAPAERKTPVRPKIDAASSNQAALTVQTAPAANSSPKKRKLIAEDEKAAAPKESEAKPEPRKTVIATTIPVKKPLVKRKPQLQAALPTAAPAAKLEAKAPPAPKPGSPEKKAPKAQATPGQTAGTIPEKKPLITKQAKAVATAEKEKVKGHTWISWTPIAIGIALASVAPQLHALAVHWDPWGVRAVFPFVQFAALHEIGMSDELTRTLPQLMLYLQFPLEGLLVASNLRRGMRFSAALGPIPALHFVAGLVLWIVALGSAKPI